MHVWKGKYDPYDKTIRDKKYMRRWMIDHLFEYKENCDKALRKAIKERYGDVDE